MQQKTQKKPLWKLSNKAIRSIRGTTKFFKRGLLAEIIKLVYRIGVFKRRDKNTKK